MPAIKLKFVGVAEKMYFSSDSDFIKLTNYRLMLYCVHITNSFAYTHCISGNVECVILSKPAFPTAKKGVLDCQKARVGNREGSIYVLHRHFGNHMAILNSFCLTKWLFAIAANTV